MNRSVSIISFALLVFLFLNVGDLLGQRYQTRTYTEADGLANSMVFNIVQDSAGLIWIGRRSGISCYDGTTFTNFNPNDGVRSNSYAYLTVDEKGCLWALNESGPLFVIKLEGKRWKTIPNFGKDTSGFMANYTSLDVSYDKNEPVILVGTYNKGFLRYDHDTWKQYTDAPGLPENNIHSIRRFEGDIYIASNKGLMVLNNNVFKPVKGSPLFSGKILALDRQGKKLWILGGSWIGYLSEGVFHLVTNGFHIPSEGTGWKCFLHAGKNGKIYFGNALNIHYYNQTENLSEILGRNNGLISEGATSALVDREMNTWITGYRGITKIASERFVSYYETDGLFSNEVASGIEVTPGRYIFGHEGGLTFYDGRKMTTYPFSAGRKEFDYQSRVLDIQKDLSGGLWLASSMQGLAYMDKNRNATWFGIEKGLPGAVFSVGMTTTGEIFIGTTAGLYKFQNERFQRVDFGKNNMWPIRKIYPGSSGSIYLATLSYGLIKIEGGKETLYKSSENQMANNVYAFFTDSKKRQWIGTSVGLYELSGKDMKRVNRSGLMISRPVYLILEDHLRNLWFGTDNGLYRWNGRILDHFTINDGLSGLEINRGAGFVDSRNHLWFGTNNGLTEFRPEFDYKPGEIPPPKVTLLSVLVGKDSLDPLQDKKLSYNQDDFNFQGRVISLINEQQIKITYFLEGFDKGWSEEQLYTGSHFIYSNLRPGTYRFFLKARNALGTWSEPVASATFVIRPPFWRSWWFLIISVLLFSAILYFIARFVLLNRYKNSLQTEVNLRTIELRNSEKELMESNAAKDSFFSIIAHDLRSPFNVILGFLELLTSEDSQISEEEQKQMLLKLKSASAKTIDLLENLLTWARSQRGILPFEPENFTLAEIIANNINLFDVPAQTKNIILHFRKDNDLQVYADRNMIDTVIRNLISNAIKFTVPGGSIFIGMEQHDGETIRVFVKDNGIGIPADLMKKLFKIEQRTVVKGTCNETGTGLGLILCKEFVEKNHGKIWVESKEGIGTTFFFSLPISNSKPEKQSARLKTIMERS